jgi:transposase InsO family protein
MREQGRSPPVDSNELFDIATSFASVEEVVGAIFDGKKGKRTDDAPAEGSKSKELHRKDKRGKKGKKPRREAREQGRDGNDAEALAVDLGPIRGQAHRQDGQIFCPRRRRAVQARRFRHPAAMRARPRGARAPPGHSRGHLRPPRRASTLVGNAFRQGFYWPTAVADASEIVRTCEGCQFYARKSNLPAHVLQTIPITWPFAKWGLDIVGPLRKAPGGFTHLLVAVDKFSKWVELRPITNLRAEQVVTFFTDIVHRSGVPNSIITGNGSQFTSRKFLEFCDKFHIRVDWAAVAHPQTNDQVERANGMILQGLKPRIFDQLNKSGRKWLQELPVVM